MARHGFPRVLERARLVGRSGFVASTMASADTRWISQARITAPKLLSRL